MREWLRGGAPPCQGGGRGFESRLALFLIAESLFNSFEGILLPLFANIHPPDFVSQIFVAFGGSLPRNIR